MTNQSAKRAEIAARLRQAREAAGLSQAQVAQLLDMHRPTVSEIEAGRRRVAAEELTTLADLYGVTVEWLTGHKSDIADVISDFEIAAREIDKLSEEDRERVLSLLTALHDKT